MRFRSFFMSDVRLISPLLVLLAGALVIPRFRPWLRQPRRAFWILAVAALAFALTLWVSQSFPARWTLSTWSLVGSQDTLRLAGTAETAPLVLLVAFVLLALSVGSLDERWEGQSLDFDAVTLAVAAGLLGVLLSANLLTLLYAFALLDIAILYAVGLPGRGRWPVTSLLLEGGADILLLAATLLVWRETGTVAFSDAVDEPQALRLLAAAFGLRLGLFPLHLWTSRPVGSPRRILALVPLVTLLGGGYWFTAGARLWGAEFVPSWLALPAALTIALMGLLVWRRDDVATKVASFAAWYAAWLVWVVAYGRPDLGLLLVVGGTLGLAALGLHAGEIGFGDRSQLSGLLAAAAVLGLPGSALFSAASWLSGQALYRGEPLAALLAVVGVAAATAGVLDFLTERRQAPRQPSRWTGLLLLSLAAWPAIGQLAGLWPQPDPVSVGRYDTALPLAIRVGPLLLGWLGGVYLWRVRSFLERARPILNGLSEFLSLAWLWWLGARVVRVIATSTRGAMRIVEGENYGWLLLFLFLAMFFLARG